jgi:8-oxo-dGTP pyrophosphatase MutT (NUDIX family)
MLDKPYENVYDTLAREIKEETGLALKKVIGDNRTEVFSPQEVDESFGFRPFCCVQQLKEGRPWVGFIFRCEVEDGEPRDAEGENQDVHWEDYDAVKKMFENTPEKLFTLELPAWDYYFKEVSQES